MATYDALHRQCRTLESLFDTKLTSYSRLASAATRGQNDVEASGSTERWKDLEIEAEEQARRENENAMGLDMDPAPAMPADGEMDPDFGDMSVPADSGVKVTRK